MTRLARIIRDLCLIGAGVFLVIGTPPSLQQVGVYGALSNVWAAMIGLGALASLAGVIWRWLTVEVYGCSFVGAGFLVWAFAASLQPDATATSYAIALVFLSGTAGQFYRVGMIVEGRVIR